MDKFQYKEGDLAVARTQCDLCSHWKKEKNRVCDVYIEVPEQVLQNLIKCPSFERPGVFRFPDT